MNKSNAVVSTIILVLIIGSSFFAGGCQGPQSEPVVKTETCRRAEELKGLRFGMFICWSFSTFSGYEWTPGVEDIGFFNPTGFEPDQWCKTAKDAGMGYILFLTKHHDGFCLWDTATTDRKVTRSPLGVDVLAEVKKSCDKYGLKLALYFSEGDWSWSGRKDIHQSVARPDIKKAQLKELLTQYGPVEFIWFDHAINDGGLSHIETVEWVHRFQPDTFCGFNTGQTAGRLNLRERGRPGAIGDKTTVWHSGHEKSDYSRFAVAEFTYPILEGQQQAKKRGAKWFYSLPENDNMAASAEKIYKDYLGAEKYGNIFSLDVGPDRSGRLRDIDVRILKKVGQYIRGEIKLPPTPCEITAVKASSVWGPEYKPECAVDNDPSTRWGAKENERAGWIEMSLARPRNVSRIWIDEGNWNRVQEFEIQMRRDADWKTIHRGNRLGSQKTITFKPVTADTFRLNIVKANEVPTIVDIKLYAE